MNIEVQSLQHSMASDHLRRNRPFTTRATAITGSLTVLLLLWHPLSVGQFVAGIFVGVLSAVLGLKQMTRYKAVFPTMCLPMFVLLGGAGIVAGLNQPEIGQLESVHALLLTLASMGAVTICFGRAILHRFETEQVVAAKRS